MAVLAHIPIQNIVSVTQGSNTYKGVRTVTVTTNKGQVTPLLPEGLLYATGAENVGTPQFPVTTSVVLQSSPDLLALINEAVGDLVIVYKLATGAANKTLTISNHQFTTESVQQALQAFGTINLSGVAFSDDGSTLPLTFS